MQEFTGDHISETCYLNVSCNTLIRLSITSFTIKTGGLMKVFDFNDFINCSNPPGPIKQKATARWPFALLWFRGGREQPFGVQPELAQQA